MHSYILTGKCKLKRKLEIIERGLQSNNIKVTMDKKNLVLHGVFTTTHQLILELCAF